MLREGASAAKDRAATPVPAWQPFLATNIDEVEAYVRSKGPLCWDVHYERGQAVFPTLLERRIGDIVLRRVHAGANRVRRGPSERKQDEEAYFCLSFLAGGYELRDSDAVRVALQPGDITTWHSSQTLSLETTGTVESLSVYIREESMHRELARSASYIGLCIKHDSSIGTLLAAYLRGLCNDVSVEDKQTETGIEDMTLGLIGAAVAGHGPLDGGSPRAALFGQTVAFIERNLEDPELNPPKIASSVGISLRYLHFLFAERGHTVAAWIRARRLVRCRADLIKSDRTVTEIAFRWGFNDAGQFSHVFRAQYGVSPRSFRCTSAQTHR